MKKIVLFFVMLFVFAFGATVDGKGNSPPTNQQLAFTQSQDQMVIQLTNEAAPQPIIMRAEVVTPRCRDVRFDFSAQYCISTCATNRIELQSGYTAINLTKESAAMFQRTEVITPRCRTVSSFSFSSYKNVTAYSEAISPACRAVITAQTAGNNEEA